ncbi:phage protein, HK97 gp10 family [Ancylobacter novellus DSM 506]|uniref:Phage protein, HK97 gp10 family n=2 Tax=Ancylobacter novellus TaxID=921 RepID=D6ZZU3_ANCN5|nr:phage protein, HK97 gp10 family [Ancylobacter novellus DSM 506]
MARSSIVGLAKLHRKIAKLPEQARTDIRAAMEKVAEQIVDLARSLVPTVSGDLRDSIGWTWGRPPRGSISLGTVARAKLGASMTITIYAGNDEAFYARWVEFGTAAHVNGGLFAGTRNPGTQARPFFYPAFRAHRRIARREVRKAIRSAARKVAKQ